MMAGCQASARVERATCNARPGINLQPDVKAKVFHPPSHREDSVGRPNSKLTTIAVQVFGVQFFARHRWEF